MQFALSLLQFLHNPLQSSALILHHNLKQCLKAAFMTGTLRTMRPFQGSIKDVRLWKTGNPHSD